MTDQTDVNRWHQNEQWGTSAAALDMADRRGAIPETAFDRLYAGTNGIVANGTALPGYYNSIVGVKNIADGNNNSIIGHECKATGNNNIVIGDGLTVVGDNQIIIGKLDLAKLIDRLERLDKLEQMVEHLWWRPGGPACDVGAQRFHKLANNVPLDASDASADIPGIPPNIKGLDDE